MQHNTTNLFAPKVFNAAKAKNKYPDEKVSFKPKMLQKLRNNIQSTCFYNQLFLEGRMDDSLCIHPFFIFSIFYFLYFSLKLFCDFFFISIILKRTNYNTDNKYEK